MNTVAHPQSCTDPDCRLSYREHLLSIAVSSAAIPTRRPSTVNTNIRESRWQRDMAAYRRLRADGFQPPQIDGSRLREKEAKDAYDIERRPVTIDYQDAS